MEKINLRKELAIRFLEYNGYRNLSIKKQNIKNNFIGYFFIFAPILVMSIFVFFTMIYGLTFLDKKGQLTANLSSLKPSSFAKNFSLLSKDKLFHSAVKNTLIFSGIILAFTLITSFILSTILNLGNIKFKKFFLIAYFLPQVTSSVASTIVFVTMLRGPLELANNPNNWFWIVVTSGLWVQTASSIVTFNTAFANVSKIEYEAAKLDGAGPIQRFFKITIPSLKPIIFYQIIMSLVFGMTAFGQSFIIISLGYVSGTNEVSKVILWPVVGFMRVKGSSGFASNVGLGMIILTILSLILFLLSFLATIIGKVNKTKEKN